jgi:hypothetical protein
MSICPLVDIRRELPVLPVLVRVTSICLLKFCGSQAYKDSGRRPLTPPNLSLYTSRLQRPNNENDYPSTEYQVKAHWRFIAASWLRIVAPLIFGRMGLILGGKLIITLLQIKLWMLSKRAIGFSTVPKIMATKRYPLVPSSLTLGMRGGNPSSDFGGSRKTFRTIHRNESMVHISRQTRHSLHQTLSWILGSRLLRSSIHSFPRCAGIRWSIGTISPRLGVWWERRNPICKDLVAGDVPRDGESSWAGTD